MALIVKQGKIWYQDEWFTGDVLIDKGKIQEIKSEIKEQEKDTVIHAEGNIVLPGLIDVHVHLREPGFEDKETIYSGSKAAVRGGFTTVAAMPNTNPIIDHPDLVKYIQNESQKAEYAKVLPIGAITIGEKGEKLANLKEMKNQGAIGFSDDGRGIQKTALMKEAMEHAVNLNLPIIAHCEDESFSRNGVIHQGVRSKNLNVDGIPSASEFVQIARDLVLAELTGVHYHVCHISTKEAVQLIRNAKARGIHVTCEVTPHHLLLTELDIKEPYSYYKMNPPLRTSEDREALLEGILDKTIDVIATDHAPHTEEEKNRGLIKAPFGITGLEIAFPLLYTHLVKKGIIKLEELINLLTKNPAQIFNIQNGMIKIGNDADLTIIDLDNEKMVDKNNFISKGKNTPFTGWKLNGWPVTTIVNGKVKWGKGDK